MLKCDEQTWLKVEIVMPICQPHNVSVCLYSAIDIFLKNLFLQSLKIALYVWLYTKACVNYQNKQKLPFKKSTS